jgi:hypothetical protein
MRLLLILCAVALLGGTAKAQNYPWCAMYNVGDEAVNCGFDSFEQCMESVRGMGGYCKANNTYKPPQPESPQGNSATATPGQDAGPAALKPSRR